MTCAARMKRVVVLDDQPREVQELRSRLEKRGVTVELVEDFEKLEAAVKENPVDAAFIDWQINDINKGPEALDIVRDIQPTAARIVFTKHSEKEEEAKERGADYFVVKGDTASEYWVEGASLGLGFARQLVQCLKEFGCTDLPEFGSGQFPNEKVEQDLKKHSARIALERATSGLDYTKLREILVRGGWRKTFDAVHYARSTWQEKLNELVRHIEISRADLGLILGVGSDVIDALLDRGTISGLTRSLSESTDHLLSVLAFVLELAQYDPELMPHYWTVKGINSPAANRPPWDSTGLKEYLTGKGPAGLMESLVWIRSN